jgi:hypothetical protein
MVRGTKETLSTTREKARASSCGKTEESTMGSGKMENNMAEASSLPRMVRNEWVSGSMERKISGFLE